MAIRPVPEGGSRASASPAYERVPPHNIEAEESVLGSMLLSKDAIAEVLELLREDDFYRPAHRTVFRSVLELYGHGDAANATYYARIVKEAGVLRRLIDVGTQIVQLGFETPQDTERAVDIAESLVYQVAQGRVTEDYHSLRDVLTGFPDLDRLTSGLQPANLIIVAARPAVGKCLAQDTLITEASTGARMTVGELVRRGRAGEDLRLHTLDEDWRFHTVRPSAFLDNGIKPVFRLTTRTGRTIRATGNHPFRTLDGWVPLGELQPGARIAVPRRLECAPTVSEVPDELVALTAYLIGDGSLTSATPRLNACGPVVRADAAAWAERAGVRAVEVAFRRCERIDCADEFRRQRSGEEVHRHTTALSLGTPWGRPNPITQHLTSMGLMGVGSAGKRIPAAYFRLPDRQIRLFLSRLYATDGWASIVRYRRRSTSRRASVKAEIGYCSTSEELARGVQHLLLRLGLSAFLRRKKVTYQGEVRYAWHVVMSHTYQVERFCREVGIFSKERQVQAVLAAIGARAGIANTDTVPRAAWRLVLVEKGTLSWAEVSARCGLPRNHNWHVGKEDIGRERLLRPPQGPPPPR